MRNRTVAVLLFAVALLTSLGWTAESWGQTKIARVGILATPLAGTTDEAMAKFYEPFRRMVAQHDWVEGKNVSFLYRSARGNPPQFAESAAEFVRLNVDVIYANSAPATRAAYDETRTIPIVALDYTNDPVAAGYAESYSRPGRNLTGLFLDAPEFASKWLELLQAIVPRLSRVAVLWDPGPGRTHLQAVQVAAKTLRVQLQVLEVHNTIDIEVAFSPLRGRPQALIVLPSPMLWGQSARIAELTLKHRLPATSMAGEFAQAGGMLSYGPDPASSFERNAALVAKILGGAKPGDLPLERPTKFKLVVNLKTARALGLTIPQSILLQADEVIQ
mgnify:CR=1 FL=1